QYAFCFIEPTFDGDSRDYTQPPKETSRARPLMHVETEVLEFAGQDGAQFEDARRHGRSRNVQEGCSTQCYTNAIDRFMRFQAASSTNVFHGGFCSRND